MSYQPRHRTDATRYRPNRDAADIETPLLDAEFDDFLDREVFAIRESLADYGNF